MNVGKSLVILGLAIVAVGLLVQFAPTLRLGRLPGDLSFGGKNWRVFFPLGTSLLLSLILTLVLALFSTLARR